MPPTFPQTMCNKMLGNAFYSDRVDAILVLVFYNDSHARKVNSQLNYLSVLSVCALRFDDIIRINNKGPR
jgi:hypothetical protein